MFLHQYNQAQRMYKKYILSWKHNVNNMRMKIPYSNNSLIKLSSSEQFK